MRIGIFIDGGFLEVVRRACRRAQKKAPRLSEFVESVRATVTLSRAAQGVQAEVIGAHWFYGEYKEHQAKKRWRDDPRGLEDHYRDELRLREELREARIESHRRDMQPRNGPSEERWCEKGIDTLLLAEALEFADEHKPEALVLVGSDGDHITLLERMHKRGIHTILVYYDSPPGSGPEGQETRTNGWLTEKADELLRIDWRDGFILLTEDELERANRERDRLALRYRQEHSEARPSPGLPK